MQTAVTNSNNGNTTHKFNATSASKNSEKLLSRDTLMTAKKPTQSARLSARLSGRANDSNSPDYRDEAIATQAEVISDLRSENAKLRRQLDVANRRRERDDNEKTGGPHTENSAEVAK